MTISNPLLVAAHEYAERGWRVVPLHAPRAGACDCHRGSECPTPGKHPRTEHGAADATTDPEAISRWWATWPHANVGLATGGGLLVLDVDPRHGGDDQLHDLEREHGGLPDDAPRVKTGGNGEHIYLHTSGEIGCPKLAAGLDIRGTGGLVVAPPSVHASGRQYEWDVTGEPAPCPQWLLDALTRCNGAPVAGVGEPIPEGRRDSTLLSLAGSMRRVGMTGSEIEAALLVVNRDRCQPPQNQVKVRELARRAGDYPAGTPRVAAPETTEAARELGDLLELPSAGLAVAGCRIIGTGREASGDIYLSDGRSITFPKLTIAMKATALMEQVVSTIGTEPKLKDSHARHAVALMRKIGRQEEATTADDLATQWGRDFIEAADVLDVDMSDQGERWAAFSHLRDRDPVGIARAEGGTVARASVVLRDHDGNLYVRTGWFKAHVRLAEDHTLSPGRLATMMLRVGWHRPGKEGRMKATRPDFPAGPDVQAFYVVPAEWDGRNRAAGEGRVTPGEGVMAGEASNAYARAHARAFITHLPSPRHLSEEDADDA